MPVPTPSQLGKRNTLTSTVSPPLIRRRRQIATNEERQELRRQWIGLSVSNRQHKDVILWFKNKYGRELSTSTISDYLGEKWAHLDDVTLSKFEKKSQRARDPEYKVLEGVLVEWQLRYDRHPDSGSTTEELLRIKSIEFQGKLPEYAGKEVPKFSNRWLDGFKKRYGLKERRRYDEGASTQINDKRERITEEIREARKEYRAENTYNIDQSAYYQKLKPDRSLLTFEAHRTKKQKARITINFYCNATGIDKLPLWFISTMNRLNCFCAKRLQTIYHLRGFQRHNKTAQMTHHIIKEYLR